MPSPDVNGVEIPTELPPATVIDEEKDPIDVIDGNCQHAKSIFS